LGTRPRQPRDEGRFVLLSPLPLGESWGEGRSLMTFEPAIQILVFGLFVGGLYGVAAVGLSLVFGVLRVLNVAHGELLMFGGYASFWLFSMLGVDPFVSLVLTAPALFLVGLLLNLLLFAHVSRLEEETKIKNSLLIGFGLALVLQSLAIQLWTADERSINPAYAGLGVNVLGIALPFTRLAGLAVAILVILALHVFLRTTYFGKAIRATAEDWEAATLAGVNVRFVYLVTFALGSALAGVAGTLVSVGYTIAPSIGVAWSIKALIVVVLAGLGSILGVLGAGLLLGLIEAISVFAIGAPYREVVGLVLFVLVLLLRPQGLFGRR
jgi:branched-chain amino acid transport system permease protein